MYSGFEIKESQITDEISEIIISYPDPRNDFISIFLYENNQNLEITDDAYFYDEFIKYLKKDDEKFIRDFATCFKGIEIKNDKFSIYCKKEEKEKYILLMFIFLIELTSVIKKRRK